MLYKINPESKKIMNEAEIRAELIDPKLRLNVWVRANEVQVVHL